MIYKNLIVFLFIILSSIVYGQDDKQDYYTLGVYQTLTINKILDKRVNNNYEFNTSSTSLDTHLFWHLVNSKQQIKNFELSILERKFDLHLDSSVLQCKDNLVGFGLMLGERIALKESRISIDFLAGTSFKMLVDRSYYNNPLTSIYSKPLPTFPESKLFYFGLALQLKLNYHISNLTYFTFGQNINWDIVKKGNSFNNYSQKFIAYSFFAGIGFNFN